jgi:hypothetical protein
MFKVVAYIIRELIGIDVTVIQVVLLLFISILAIPVFSSHHLDIVGMKEIKIWTGTDLVENISKVPSAIGGANL